MEKAEKSQGAGNGLHAFAAVRKRKPIIIFAIIISSLCALYFVTLLKSDKPFVFVSKEAVGSNTPKTQYDSVVTGRRADWSTPDFCSRIIANPQPVALDCKRNESDMTCSNIEGGPWMFSQFQQDYYIYTRHFKHLKRPGVYVDIAANDAIKISNTYFFDRCLGWKGVCVEGNPNYFEKLYRERSCHIVPTCVGSTDGEKVTFALFGGGSGVISDTYKLRNHVEKNGMRTLEEKCTTMKQVLARENIQEIDYLSLDVEGHEAPVLKGFDFDRVKVNLMTIEVTGTALKTVEDFLIPKGYKRHLPDMVVPGSRLEGVLREDAVFLHESVEFGSPV